MYFAQNVIWQFHQPFMWIHKKKCGQTGREKMENPSAAVLHFTVDSFLMGWCTNILEIAKRTSKIWLMHYWLLLQLCSSRCSMHPSWLTSERRRRSTTSTKKLTQPFPWLFKQTGRSWATKLLLLILRNLPKSQQTKNSMKKLSNENYFQWNLFPFSDELIQSTGCPNKIFCYIPV